MKKELKYLIYANVILLLSVIYYTFDLLTLIIDDTMDDAFLPSELNNVASNFSTTSPGPSGTDNSINDTMIPKIIHQTYKTNDIPEHWKEGQRKCIELHSDYEYILWTDEMALNFIEREYPWFLDTFKNYQYPIQRADAIRYFVLLTYGGVYIDLDDGCERKLDPLLKFPAFLRKTSPTGVSNDVMGSIPNHPFFEKVIHSLKHYDKTWFAPYFTIMGSTGPLFISVVWKQYKRWYHGNGVNDTVKILQPEDYKLHSQSFFSISKGSSWHLDDAEFIKSFGNHILSCVVAGFIFGFFVLYSEYWFYCWLCSKSSKNNLNRLWNFWQLNNYSEESLPAPLSLQQKRSRKDSNAIFIMNHLDLEKNDVDNNR
ncbi:hypothetical protein KAFR_0A01170 [Kazachstania africana CBS 2517]|uniref:inositol phosphorylceramide mannosyltransferase n=1 Tax=Kazachstania africana (strain ATCC 22294 / BCRC 22015 / CBS 2517 / CECT 1963 / NBRC 1671 / NRRL Y-8276) TaxID=1071382 RepID=H2AMF6_KAZAF|nr:hypothetical protein KAFR_0A01170 [Kazachstania africana CBS 2517]CCF55556.1 hypothetical protein KAFR_0A01170 [Kazachstania africana CBS 2517]